MFIYWYNTRISCSSSTQTRWFHWKGSWRVQKTVGILLYSLIPSWFPMVPLLPPFSLSPSIESFRIVDAIRSIGSLPHRSTQYLNTTALFPHLPLTCVRKIEQLIYEYVINCFFSEWIFLALPIFSFQSRERISEFKNVFFYFEIIFSSSIHSEEISSSTAAPTFERNLYDQLLERTVTNDEIHTLPMLYVLLQLLSS